MPEAMGIRRSVRALAMYAGFVALGACASAGTGPEPAELAALLDCARTGGVTLLSAHRAGPRAGRPENSLAAIEASVADGALFLEVDVAQTADGELVLMHDRTLDRTTTGSGPIAEQTFSALQVLRLVDADGRVHDAPPPSLAQAFASARDRAFLQLDVKGVAPERLVAAIRDADAAARVLVITYSVEDALELHALAPELVLSVGIDSMAEFEALGRAGLASDRIVVWLGIGNGDRVLDAALAEQGVETSYADFRGERATGWDYAVHASAGAEILSVDDVRAAARALDARRVRDQLLATCGAGD